MKIERLTELVIASIADSCNVSEQDKPMIALVVSHCVEVMLESHSAAEDIE